MRPTLAALVPAAVLALAATPAAAAVPSNRAIALEFGLSPPPRPGAAPARLLALTASAWLEGPLEATATVAWADPAGRGAAPLVLGAAGLRARFGRTWQGALAADLGWASDGAAVRGTTCAASVGLGRALGAVTVAARVGWRALPTGGRAEAWLGASAAF
jgi:hypothetical protein